MKSLSNRNLTIPRTIAWGEREERPRRTDRLRGNTMEPGDLGRIYN